MCYKPSYRTAGLCLVFSFLDKLIEPYKAMPRASLCFVCLERCSLHFMPFSQKETPRAFLCFVRPSREIPHRPLLCFVLSQKRGGYLCSFLQEGNPAGLSVFAIVDIPCPPSSIRHSRLDLAGFGAVHSGCISSLLLLPYPTCACSSSCSSRCSGSCSC